VQAREGRRRAAVQAREGGRRRDGLVAQPRRQGREGRDVRPASAVGGSGPAAPGRCTGGGAAWPRGSRAHSAAGRQDAR
jgi:hypothetical protein